MHHVPGQVLFTLRTHGTCSASDFWKNWVSYKSLAAQSLSALLRGVLGSEGGAKPLGPAGSRRECKPAATKEGRGCVWEGALFTLAWTKSKTSWKTTILGPPLF